MSVIIDNVPSLLAAVLHDAHGVPMVARNGPPGPGLYQKFFEAYSRLQLAPRRTMVDATTQARLPNVDTCTEPRLILTNRVRPTPPPDLPQPLFPEPLRRPKIYRPPYGISRLGVVAYTAGVLEAYEFLAPGYQPDIGEPFQSPADMEMAQIQQEANQRPPVLLDTLPPLIEDKIS